MSKERQGNARTESEESKRKTKARSLSIVLERVCGGGRQRRMRKSGATGANKGSVEVVFWRTSEMSPALLATTNRNIPVSQQTQRNRS